MVQKNISNHDEPGQKVSKSQLRGIVNTNNIIIKKTLLDNIVINHLSKLQT